MNKMSVNDILKNIELTSNGTKPFNEFRKMLYSQCGEDGVILELLRLIKNEINFYVEFGAWDGLNLSNTANLRINEKWNGILFEADKSKVRENNINLFHEKITSNSINKIFETYKVPYEFGLLSIDIDGDDSYCWQSLDDKFKPNLVIIEYNPGLPNTIPIRVIENESCVDNGYFGSNVNLLYDLGISKGYEFVTTVDWNAIFVRKEKYDLLNISKIDKDEVMKIHTKGNGCSEYRSRMIVRNDLWIVNEIF